MRSFDGVVVIHDRFQSQVVDGLGVATDRVSVIRNWTHVKSPPAVDVPSARQALGWGDEEFVVLHAGAIGVKQDLINVVEAAKLAETTGAPLRFVLLGGGSQRGAVEVASRGVRTIELRDQLEESAFQQALGAADVLLVNELPELSDMAVPSKLTTYFTTGKPIVAATGPDSATAGELEASGAGVRVAPGRPMELVDALLDLRERPEDARRMGANGRAYCETVLTERVALSAYNEWIARLAEPPRDE